MTSRHMSSFAAVSAIGIWLVSGTSSDLSVSSTRDGMAKPDTIIIHLPDWRALPQKSPIWTTTLEKVRLDDGSLWSSGSITSLAYIRGSLVGTDAVNNQLVVISASTGRITDIVGMIGQRKDDLWTPQSIAVVRDSLLVVEGGNHRLKWLDRELRAGATFDFGDDKVPTLVNIDNGVALLTRSESGTHIKACCSRSAARKGFSVPLRTLLQIHTRDYVGIGPEGAVYRFDRGGQPRRVYVFESATENGGRKTFIRLPAHTLAAPPRGDRIAIAAGPVVMCFDPAKEVVESAWLKPVRNDVAIAQTILTCSAEGIYGLQRSHNAELSKWQQCGHR